MFLDCISSVYIHKALCLETSPSLSFYVVVGECAPAIGLPFGLVIGQGGSFVTHYDFRLPRAIGLTDGTVLLPEGEMHHVVPHSLLKFLDENHEVERLVDRPVHSLVKVHVSSAKLFILFDERLD